MTSALVVPFEGNEAIASAIATRVGGSVAMFETRSFPDGETYFRYRDDVKGRAVVLVCSLDRPNAKFLPLVFAADAARDCGAVSVALVAPYLAYMRQDKRFQAGEAVTSVSFAGRLSSTFDALVTVDPHLHRYKSLDAIYSIPAEVAQSAPVIAQWIAAEVERPFVIGPDVESEQWVGQVAGIANSPFRVLQKERRGDRDVRITIPDLSAFKDRTPVLVDDIVSSGRTMLETAKLLRSEGMAAPICIAVHALLADDAYRALLGHAATVISTNTIRHKSNRIDISVTVAEAAASCLAKLQGSPSNTASR